MTVIDELILKTTTDGGLSKALSKATKEASRYGATATEQADAMKSVVKEAKIAGTTTETMTLAFRGLVKETQDASEAAKHLGTTMKVQLATGINSSAAAAKAMGDLLGGGTKLLRSFDAEAKAAADAIDKISDPAKRAALAQEALNAALKRHNSLARKAKDAVAGLKAKLVPLAPAFKAGGIAAGALAAIISGVLLASIKHYLSNSAAMEQSQKQLNTAVDEFKFQLGGAVVAGGKTGDMLGDVTSLVKDATGWVKQNSDQIGEWARMAIRGGARVVQGVGMIGLGLASLVAFVIDGVRGLVRKALGPIFTMINSVVERLEKMGLVKDLAKDTRELAKAFTALGEADMKFSLTGKVTDMIDAMNRAVDGIDAKFSGSGKGSKGGGGIGGRKRKTGGGGGGGRASVDKGTDFGDGSKVIDDIITEMQREQWNSAAEGINTMVKPGIFSSEDLQRLEEVREGMKRYADQVMETRQAIIGLGESADGTMAKGMTSMIAGLMDGTAKIKDIGKDLVNMFGGILKDMGTSLAIYAIKSAGVFKMIGIAFQTMAATPWALPLVAGGLLAAGIALQAFSGGGAGGGGSTGSARAAAGGSAAGDALERLAGQIFNNIEDGRQAQTMTVQFGDRQMTGMIVDAVNHGQRTGAISSNTLQPGGNGGLYGS